jgi:uncharacterized membrane protein
MESSSKKIVSSFMLLSMKILLTQYVSTPMKASTIESFKMPEPQKITEGMKRIATASHR